MFVRSISLDKRPESSCLKNLKIHYRKNPTQMNITLYYSSIILGACIVCISLLTKYTPKMLYLYSITFLAIITSIMNHGSTNTLYKLVDRVVIYIAAIVYLYYIFLIKSSLHKAVALSMIIAMILLYFYSKYVKQRRNKSKNNAYSYTHIHLLCHILSVMLFYILVTSIHLRNSFLVSPGILQYR
jgi:hypothetical protein